MSPPHTQVAPSRLVVLPAELRNRVYEYLLNENPAIQRLVLLLQPPTDDRTHLLRCAAPISQVCMQLRREYLPLWMSSLQAGVSTKDTQRFIDTFCRTTYVGGTLRTLCPQRIIGYFPGYDKGHDAPYSASVDILPLLKFRSEAPGFTCLFAAEPITHEERDARYDRVLEALMPNPTSAAMSEFTSLLDCDNKDWVDLVQGQHLSKVMLHPYTSYDSTNVTLVFYEQAAGMRPATMTKRCYAPEIRRLGSEEVYFHHTSHRTFESRLEAQVVDAEEMSWSPTMFEGIPLEESVAGGSIFGSWTMQTPKDT